MEKIITPSRTRKIIEENAFVFRKKYGQNFLIDEHVLNKIIDTADISANDYVLEIGPGIGSLTQALAEGVGMGMGVGMGVVTAVEIDRDLLPILNENLKDYSNINIVNADFLKLDLPSLLNDILGNETDKRVKVVANLPYYITTTIIMSLLENSRRLQSITVMVQKEVAERMCAAPGTKDYGGLSVAVQFYGKPYIAAYVPPHSFMPRPDVTSAVLSINVYDKPPVDVVSNSVFFMLTKAGFAHRRKTLVNSLSMHGFYGLSKSEIADTIKGCGFDENIRAEVLSIRDFSVLANAFAESAIYTDGN